MGKIGSLATVQALRNGRWRNMGKVANGHEARRHADDYARMYGGGRVLSGRREVHRRVYER